MAEQEPLKSMTVMIAGRSYPVKVDPGDEEQMEAIVREINEKFTDFQLTYLQKDQQDCLAMTLLTYAVDFHKLNENPRKLSTAVAAKVDSIQKMIDEIL